MKPCRTAFPGRPARHYTTALSWAMSFDRQSWFKLTPSSLASANRAACTDRGSRTLTAQLTEETTSRLFLLTGRGKVSIKALMRLHSAVRQKAVRSVSVVNSSSAKPPAPNKAKCNSSQFLAVFAHVWAKSSTCLALAAISLLNLAVGLAFICHRMLFGGTPNAHRPVIASRCRKPPVAGKRHRPHRTNVALQHPQQFAIINVPQNHLAVLPR